MALMWVRLPPLLLFRGQCVTALFLSQRNIMPRVMVTIDIKKFVCETWEFDLFPGENPDQVLEMLKNNPDLLWTKYTSNLVYADDVDEFITNVESVEIV